MAGKMGIETKVSSGKMSPLKMTLWILLAVTLIVSPIIFEGFGLIFITHIMALVGIYIMLALGLNIVVGYAGLLDLGYVAFYAIGAYSGVIIGSWVYSHWASLGPWVYFMMIPVAAAAAAFTGILLGTPVLRLRGDYLAIVTLGFGEIVRIIITNNAFGITNGAAGLPAAGQFIPSPVGLDWLTNHIYIPFPNIGPNGFTIQFDNNMYWYYVVVLLCLLTIFVVRRLDASRLGRSWAAMREDEVAASSMGVSITGAKLWAFSLGALWGGIAGLTFANFQQFVSPESFTFMESVFIVCTIVIGGMGSIAGPIVGAAVIQGIPALIQGMALSGIITLTAEQTTAISNYRYLVFGLLMVIMMAVRPQGIFPAKRRAAELVPDDDEIAEIESESLYDAQHESGMPGL